MKVLSVMNFSRSHGINHSDFKFILSEIDANMRGGLISFRTSVVESLSSVEMFLDMRILMNEKAMAELNDEK
jgi:hypothetical protein